MILVFKTVEKKMIMILQNFLSGNVINNKKSCDVRSVKNIVQTHG